MRVFVVTLLVSSLLLPTNAVLAEDYAASVGYAPPELEPRPRKGLGAIIAGSVLMLGALESFALLGMCGLSNPIMDLYANERSCRIANGTVGAVSISVGASVLALGLVRRKRYKAWRTSQHALNGLSPMVFGSNGSGFSWATRF